MKRLIESLFNGATTFALCALWLVASLVLGGLPFVVAQGLSDKTPVLALVAFWGLLVLGTGTLYLFGKAIDWVTRGR